MGGLPFVAAGAGGRRGTSSPATSSVLKPSRKSSNSPGLSPTWKPTPTDAPNSTSAARGHPGTYATLIPSPGLYVRGRNMAHNPRRSWCACSPHRERISGAVVSVPAAVGTACQTI